MGETTRPPGRRYGGRDATQRQAERRTKLLAAGLELFGTGGYSTTSVRAVCQEARLTERYFYETARDREDLLAAVYDELVREVQTVTFEAARQAGPGIETRIRAGLDRFVRTLTDDPRKARVVLVEVVGASPRLEARRHAVIQEFAAFIAAIWREHRPDAEPEQLQMTAVALVGGVNELLVAHTLAQAPQSSTDVAALIDICVALFVAALTVTDRPTRAGHTRG